MAAFVFNHQFFILCPDDKVLVLPGWNFFDSTLKASHAGNRNTALALGAFNGKFVYWIIIQTFFAITVEVVLFPERGTSYIGEVWKVWKKYAFISRLMIRIFNFKMGTPRFYCNISATLERARQPYKKYLTFSNCSNKPSSMRQHSLKLI